MDAMRGAAGPDFSDDELYELAVLYASFMRKPRDTVWSEAADRAGLPADKRSLYADVAERVNAKTDAGKVREYSALGTAMHYGHPSIYSINIFTEFRPVSGENGIAHLVPYLVVDGTVSDPSADTDRPIKIQLNPTNAKRLAEEIASGPRGPDCADYRNAREVWRWHRSRLDAVPSPTPMRCMGTTAMSTVRHIFSAAKKGKCLWSRTQTWTCPAPCVCGRREMCL